MKRLLLVGLIVAMIAPSALAEDLQLTKGTIQLGGSVTFSLDMFIPDEGDKETGFMLRAMPSGGYFLMDNLALVGALSFGKGFGKLYKDWFPMEFGIDVGAKYFIPMGSMAIYAGAMVGMTMLKPDEGDSSKWLDIIVPVGILIPMNAHIGIDLGMHLGYHMGLDDQGSSLGVPIGYLGVQGFF